MLPCTCTLTLFSLLICLLGPWKHPTDFRTRTRWAQGLVMPCPRDHRCPSTRIPRASPRGPGTLRCGGQLSASGPCSQRWTQPAFMARCRCSQVLSLLRGLHDPTVCLPSIQGAHPPCLPPRGSCSSSLTRGPRDHKAQPGNRVTGTRGTPLLSCHVATCWGPRQSPVASSPSPGSLPGPLAGFSAPGATFIPEHPVTL